MKVRAYIDGFNLYYGGVRNTKFKWLDLHSFCQKLVPNDELIGVKYFTAKVKATRKDPDKASRQMIYWRALHTIPNLEIVEGHYSTQRKHMPLVNPRRRAKLIEVYKNEEKRSDVNLAVHLVSDGYEGAYQKALVVTNDYDLEGAITRVSERLELPVTIARPPNHPYPSKGLRDLAAKYQGVSVVDIRQWMFGDSQFPEKIGQITCPKDWK